jgi:hypothetical protein
MKRVVGNSCIAALLSIGAVAFAQTTGQNPAGASGQAGSPTMTAPRDTQTGDRSQTQQQVTLVGCIQREAEYRQAAGSGRGGALGTGAGVGNEFVLVNASMGSSSGSPSAMGGTSTSPSSGTGTASATAGTTGTTAGTTAAGTTSTSPTTGAAGTTSGTASTPSPSSSASSTSSMSGAGKAYALSGSREKDLEQYVGQRVEIVGNLERGAGASTGATGTTPGTTASGTTSGTGTASTGTAGATTSGTAGATTSGTTSGTTASGTGTSGSAGMQRFGDLQTIDIVSFKPVGGSCQP